MGKEHPFDREPAGAGRPDEDDGKQSGAPTDELGGATELDRQPSRTDSTAPEDLTVLRSDLRFHALRNAYYHSARLRWFELQHRVLMFAIVLFGTAGVATLFGTGGSGVLAALTALLASADLVLDLRGKAQLHDALKRRYYMLLAKLDEEPDASAAKLRRWNARIIRITAEEPVSYRAVDALARNEAIDTLGLDEDDKEVVTSAQYRWRHWSPYQGVTFPLAKEMSDRPDAAAEV